MNNEPNCERIARLKKLAGFIGTPGSIYFDYASDLDAILAEIDITSVQQREAVADRNEFLLGSVGKVDGLMDDIQALHKIVNDAALHLREGKFHRIAGLLEDAAASVEVTVRSVEATLAPNVEAIRNRTLDEVSAYCDSKEDWTYGPEHFAEDFRAMKRTTTDTPKGE